MNDISSSSIIFFDGVCNLCNGSVRFIIEHDKKEHFVFAALQSEQAQRILSVQHVTSKMDSIVLVEGGKVFTKSTAALRIARKLNGAWSLLYGFIIVPVFLRDGVYDLIAKYRYKVFGKTDTCMVPTPALRRRFIE